MKVQVSEAEETAVKHVDPLKQKQGPWSEVPKHVKAVKGPKRKRRKKDLSANGESRKDLMKMKVQFVIWQNVYKLYLWTYSMCCYIIAVTFAFFQMMKPHTTPTTSSKKHAAHTPANVDMPKTRKGSGGKTIKTLPKLRVSNNLTCFPIPSEMMNLSSATLTIGRTRTAEVQKCHFCL